MKARTSDKESVMEVMGRVSQLSLLYYYLSIDSLPKLICSPLRRDEHPSFFIYSPDGSKVLFKDYATGEHGDVYELLQKMKGITFAKLIRMISSDKELLKETADVQVRNPGEKGVQCYADLRVKTRDWEEHDIEYWSSYGISLRWLQYAEVYPISHKIVYKDGRRYVFHAAKYAYVFVERKEGNVSLKIYQPHARQYKWCTNNDHSVVGLWTKIPQKGDRLAVCSSLKDALCLWANAGIPAIYVQSETTGLSRTAQEVLRSRYRRIFICFDNDEPGLKDGEELSRKTGFVNVVLPQFEGGKDISDMYRVKGKEEFINVVKPLFDGREQEGKTC